MKREDCRLEVLDAAGAQAIVDAALRLLERSGLVVIDAGLRRRLERAGARVSDDRVHLPAGLVQELLASAPNQVTFHGRDGRRLSSAEGGFYHGVAPSAVAVIDEDGRRRASTYRDVADLTRLADALPGIDFISPPAIAQDCAPADTGLLTAQATFCNTARFCLVFALNRREAEAWLDLAHHAAGSWGTLVERPLLGFAISPVSPLVLPGETSDILLAVAERGLPIVTVPGGMAGATSPYTLAGTLVVELAEALVVIAVAQMVRPGTPCLLGLATAVMDMASGNVCLGSAERSLILNAVAPLARCLGLPGYAPVGLTDSFALDEQAGGEKMLSLVSQALSGLSFGSGAGRFEGGLSTSYAGLLLDHELLQTVRRFLAGIRVDEDSLAEAVTAGVGPGGNFLNHEHTLKHLRSPEFQGSRLWNRRARDNGGRPAAETAWRRVAAILEEHVSPVAEDQQAAFRQIVDDYRAVKSA